MRIPIKDQSNSIAKLELGNPDQSRIENYLISLHSIAVGNMNRYNGIPERNGFILSKKYCLYKRKYLCLNWKNNISILLVSASECAGGEIAKSSKLEIEEPRRIPAVIIIFTFARILKNAEAGPVW